VTYDHGIVAIAVKLASRGVSDGDIVECGAGLEGELGDYSEGLVGNEAREWVLRLFCESFWKWSSVLFGYGDRDTHDNPWRRVTTANCTGQQ
jgi:hypothetical protein